MNEQHSTKNPDRESPRPRRKHRLLWAVLIVLVALVALVALAPTILSLGVFRGTILAQAEKALPARLAADGLSLSWFGSQEIRGLAIQTTDGERIARADRITLHQGVLELLADRSYIGAVAVEDAEVWSSGIAKLREAMAARQAAAPPKPQPPGKEGPPTLPHAVHLANVTVHSGKADLKLIEADFNANESMETDRLRATWEATTAGERGQGTVDLVVKNLRTNWDALDAGGSLKLQRLPLAMACSMAADFGVELSGAGLLSGTMEFHLDASGGLSAKVSCSGDGVAITGKALNNDRLALKNVQLDANVAYAGNKLTISKFDLKSPLANADAQGDLTLASARGEPPTGNLTGHLTVSLAPLAAMLRNTLGMQKDITLDSGQLAATVEVRSNEKTASLDLSADVKDLSGKRGDKVVALKQVHVAANVDRERPAAGAPPMDALATLRALRVNSLQLTAPFGSIQAAGQLEAFTLDANLDLTDTTEKVGQFIDLGGRTAQGTASVHLETRGDFDKGVQLTGAVDLADVRLALGSGRIWQEQKAAIALGAAATFTPARDLATLAVSKLDVDASTAKLSATGNLSRLAAGWGFSGDVSGSGQIARAAGLADVVLALTGSEKPAATAAAGSPPLVTDLVRRAAAAEGQWSLRARVENADGKALGIAFGVQLANLSLLLGPQGAAPIQISTLAASGSAQQAEGGPWNVKINDLRVAAPDLSLAATCDAAIPVGPDAKPVTLRSGSIAAEGAVARTLGLADSILTFVAAKDASGKGSAPTFLRQLAGGSGTPPTGNWKLQAKAASAAGSGLNATFEVQANDVALLLDPKHSGPVRIATASFTGTAQQPEGGPWHFVVTDGRVTTPEINLAARADVTLPADFNLDALSGTVAAQANISLATATKTLRSFGLMPEGTDAAGSAAVTLQAKAEAERSIEAAVTAKATDLAIAWAEGRKIAQPTLNAAVTATATRDAKGGISEVNVSQWTVEVPAARLQGTATMKPAGDAWAYHVAADGNGDIQQLAQIIASATGGKPSAIRGQWKLKGDLDQNAAGQRINLAATATNLVVPPEMGAGKELRLADLALDASAAIAPSGAIAVRQATVTGPGITAKAAGTLRLPKDKSDKMDADGTLSVEANLAELAKLLQPFGLLAPKSVLAGMAELNGKVASSATGVHGAGTLSLTALDVSLAEAGIVLKEPQATVPLSIEYASAARRWTATLTGIASATLKGNASFSYTEPASPAVIQGECNLAFDGERLTAALGKNLPQGLRLTGPWGVAARASGPLPSGDRPWNQKIAGLTGEGAIDVGTFRHEKLSGGKGAIRWRLAGGEIIIADPAQPSQLTLAGGRMNLAARVDLKGATARLIIPQPLRLLENVPLSDPGVQDYLKFGSAVLSGSVNPEGRLFVEIDSLDLPLAAEEKNKAVGTGRFRIDKFQTELSGPMAAFLASLGTPRQSPVQTFGPVLVQLAGGILRISEHKLLLSDDSTLLFHGNIGLDRSLAFEMDLPITDKMLGRFGANASAVQYLANQKIAVPMTGTIDKPHLDDKVVAKRVGEMVMEAMKRRTAEEIGNMLKGGLKPKKK